MLLARVRIVQVCSSAPWKTRSIPAGLVMVRKMDELCFGYYTNERECEAECPKEISISNIARMNREFLKAGIGSAVMQYFIIRLRGNDGYQKKDQ